MGVPTAAVPEMTTLFPAADCSSAPTAGPLVTFTAVALATCDELDARSNTVNHRLLAEAASVGRTSVRHNLLKVRESVE